MSTSDLQTALKDLLKKAASDADFRAKALKDPATALKEAGVELPAGQSIKFVEKVDEIVIPLPPVGASDTELTDNVLSQAAGGAAATPSYNSEGRPVRCTVSWIM